MSEKNQHNYLSYIDDFNKDVNVNYEQHPEMYLQYVVTRNTENLYKILDSIDSNASFIDSNISTVVQKLEEIIALLKDR